MPSKAAKRLMLIDVVGLTKGLLGKMPWSNAWAAHKQVNNINPMLPALTCAVQATYLTGKTPAGHGIVGNGWYNPEISEINLWRQSYGLLQAPYIWHQIRQSNPDFKVCNTGWWFNMYSGAEYSVTPRPQYRADGIKVPDCYTEPPQWRDELQAELGQFPLFHYWGPRTTIQSSAWLAKAAIIAERKWQPDLNLVYLPHLDYCLQRRGDDHPDNQQDLDELDQVLKTLITEAEASGLEVWVISEYGINTVSRPVHLNRVLRKAGYLRIREENGGELLDAPASPAFAVADHQVAHIYIQDKAQLEPIKALLAAQDGVAQVLSGTDLAAAGLDNPRAGDLVVVANQDAWFTYYYWLDDTKAPDFARIVDIHKKPGYDPVELFINPKMPLPILQVGLKLLRKKLGFRYLMDVIPLDATLVKGSHGAIHADSAYHPVLIGNHEQIGKDTIAATDVYTLLRRFLG